MSVLQDEVPYIKDFSIVRSIIETELGKPLCSLFSSFDEVPIGSASIVSRILWIDVLAVILVLGLKLAHPYKKCCVIVVMLGPSTPCYPSGWHSVS